MFLGIKVRLMLRADNLADCLGSLTSHNPIGLQGLLQDSFTLLLLLQSVTSEHTNTLRFAFVSILNTFSPNLILQSIHIVQLM
jgi:hypothetical protein